MAEITSAFEAYYTRWTEKMAKGEGAVPPDALHYGYSEDPTNYQGRAISKRATNTLVARALNLSTNGRHQIADLGCGVGGSAAYMAEHYPQSNINALNIFRPQLELLKALGNTAGGRVVPVEGDFMANPFDGESLDGAYAIESSCYAPDKRAFYQETLRSLRSGGRLVVCDVFDMREPHDSQERTMYQKSVEGWAVPHWHPVPADVDNATTEFRNLTPHMMPDITLSYEAALDRIERNPDPVAQAHSEAIVNSVHGLEAGLIQYGLLTLTKL